MEKKHHNCIILSPSYVYPTGTLMGENVPVDIRVGRNDETFPLKRQFPSCCIISPLLLKGRLSQLWNLKNLESTLIWWLFFFFRWEILQC